MKKIGIDSIIVCVLAAALLTGCGDGSLFVGTDTDYGNFLITLPPESLLSETEAAIQTYELKYSSGEFSLEDYQVLAGLYEEQSMIRRQRDMLEQAYRLYGDEEAFHTLQTIAVNVAEEDALVQRETQSMLQNLEIEEYQGEAIHMIESREWFELMMPKLSEGVRNYFVLREGQQVMTVQVGYDEGGNPFSNIWYTADNQAIVLSWSGNVAEMLFAGMSAEGYNGDFTLWSFNGATGDIRQEQGTMINGICTGAYQVRLHTGDTGGDLYDLWCNRENMEYQSYAGEFDGSGATVLEQPAGAKLAALVKGTDYSTCLVYAYDESRENCLFVGLEREGEGYVFGAESMGLPAEPVFPIYEAIAQDDRERGEGQESGDKQESGVEQPLQIRIYDGEIQYLSGSSWVTMGSVLQYQSEDPFRMYADNKAQNDTEKRNQTEETGSNAGYFAGNFRVGSVTADSPTAAPPAAQRPATTPPVAQRPATTPPAAPQNPTPAAPPAAETPEEPSWDNDDNDDGGDSGNDNSSNDNSGNDSGGGDSGASGADVDVEWTPDML